MAIDGTRIATTLLFSLVAVAVLSYGIAAVAGGTPLMSTLDSVGGVHLEADYVEGSGVEILPEFEGPNDCDTSFLLAFDDATVAGAAVFAELAEPLSDGSTQVGLELDEDEHELGSAQLIVSELDAEYDAEDMSLSTDEEDEGFSVQADEFRLENLSTRVYGFGTAWFDAPFVRTEYEPNRSAVEEHRC